MFETQHVTFTQMFANALEPQLSPFFAMVDQLSPDQIREYPETTLLHIAIQEQMMNTAVIKVKLYNLTGLTVFSSDPRQIGEDKWDNSGFQNARTGNPATELTHRATFSAFEGVIENRDVVSSYLPIRHDDTIVAVFEVYSDATQLLAYIDQARQQAAAIIIVSLGTLYGFLLIIIWRAQYTLHQGHLALEARVAERTKALSEANSQLQRGNVVHHETVEALRASEERYRQAVNNSPNPIFSVDRKGIILSWNPACETIFQYSFDSIGYPFYELLLSSADRDVIMGRLTEVFQGQALQNVDIRYQCKDGSERHMVSRLYPVYSAGGAVQSCVFANTDITQRCQTEAALRESEARYQLLFEAAPDALYISDLQGTLIDGNQMAEKLVGYTRAELVGKSFLNLHLLSPQLLPKAAILLARNAFGKSTGPDEFTLIRKDGSAVEVEISTFPIQLNDQQVVLGVARDITARKQTELELHRHRNHLEQLITERTIALETTNRRLEQEIGERQKTANHLRASLEEKELLLKEIHHRVKNNLQVIVSLLSLQARTLTDTQAVTAIADSQNRVRTMALIHDQLYQSKDLTHIDLEKYIRELTLHLLQAHHSLTDAINLTTNISDIHLNLDVAIPCGLIINELITNALKHAFPNGRTGTIEVVVQKRDSRHLTLTISDNGIGLPAGIDTSRTQTLGLQLVNRLTSQLKGTIQIDGSLGTSVIINFEQPFRNEEING